MNKTMKIKVFIERTNQKKIVEAKTIQELLKKLAINPQTVIIIKKNELVTEEEPLEKNDEIKLLSVISGG